jgi:serine protease Do
VDDQVLSGLVETDAAINPGNSGGPLVNMAGEVIGITSVKIAQVEVESVGYAIGITEAAPLIQQLVTSGFVTRPFLGVTMSFITPATMAQYDLNVDAGALIVDVQPGSPADEAGLRVGDVIVRFNNRETDSIEDLRQAIHQSQIGQTVPITYWRGNARQETTARLVANRER